MVIVSLVINVLVVTVPDSEVPSTSSVYLTVVLARGGDEAPSFVKDLGFLPINLTP
jgi:hypothetical protein